MSVVCKNGSYNLGYFFGIFFFMISTVKFYFEKCIVDIPNNKLHILQHFHCDEMW